MPAPTHTHEEVGGRSDLAAPCGKNQEVCASSKLKSKVGKFSVTFSCINRDIESRLREVIISLYSV